MWVLPLEKSLGSWPASRTAALEQDMLFGHYVSKQRATGWKSLLGKTNQRRVLEGCPSL